MKPQAINQKYIKMKTLSTHTVITPNKKEVEFYLSFSTITMPHF